MKHEVQSTADRDFGGEMLKSLHELEDTSGLTLSRFEKILLAELATVEQVLSIIADSSIKVTPLEQVQEDDGVLVRRALLSDADQNSLLLAESRIYTQQLPAAILDDLLGGRGGIGTILRRYAVETIRRIEHLGYDDEAHSLYRRYLIIHGGEVWFDIREEFQAGRF